MATGETPAKLFMGREIQTRIDVMKPHSKVGIVRSIIPYKNKYRQSLICNLEVGNMVQMGDYSSRRKWVRGRITNEIGNKMYEVLSGVSKAHMSCRLYM